LIYRVLRAALPEPVKRPLRRCLHAYRQHAYRRKWRSALELTKRSFAKGGRRRYAVTPKQVVFVSEVPRGREAKLAHGLRRKGWNVVLLHKSRGNYDHSRYFDASIPFTHPEEAVGIALQYTPVAYHLFALAGDLSALGMLRASIGPTIFDTTDLLETTYLGNFEKTERARDMIEMQKSGLRYADGYCARDLQFKYAARTLGYELGGRPLFFPEYCWGVAREPSASQERNDARHTIRCVQAGNFGVESLGEGDWGYLRIAERFIEERVRLDLYPNWIYYGRGDEEFRKIFADYFALARTTDYFELHRPIQADELADRLSTFDFGVNIIWAEVAGLPSTSFNAAFHPYCMSARVFDYLDAGLPVVLSKSHRLVHAMLRRYGVGIVADRNFMNNIERILRPLATAEMKRRAVAASHGLAIERHAHRLEKFYNLVAADVGFAAG